GVIYDLFRLYVPEESVEEQWDIAGLEGALKAEFNLELPLRAWLEAESELQDETLLERIVEKAHAAYAAKVPAEAEQQWHQFERYKMLEILDVHWREHLAALDHLRQGIHLRGYAQKNPKQEYKREAFELFSLMLDSVRNEVIRILMTVQIRGEQDVAAVEEPVVLQNVSYQHAEY